MQLRAATMRDHTAIDQGSVSNTVADVASLVARAKLGDTAAFTLLYRAHIDRIYAFTARRLSDRELAEDATQEIFTRALAGIGRCREDAAFTGWLFAIARHVVNEQYRHKQRAAGSLAGDHDLEDHDLGPEERALQGETSTELASARERCLKPNERELFDLMLADLTDKEIAAALGRRSGAIRTAQWRLMIKLRACLGIVARKGGGRDAAA